MIRRLVGFTGVVVSLLLPMAAQAQTSSGFPFNLLTDNRKFNFTIPSGSSQTLRWL